MPASKKSDKEIKDEKTQLLIEMTASFSNEYLDEDYKELCEKLIRKMARKRNVPFLFGRIEIWAAAIIHALGSINFLFDNSFEPYASTDDICNFFSTSKSTTSQKGKVIRDMFKMNYYDKDFSTTYMNENNPYSEMTMVNGFIVPSDMLPILKNVVLQNDLPDENEVKNDSIYLMMATLNNRHFHSSEAVFRIFAIKGEARLYTLAKTILKYFNFDFDHLFGFYSNLKEWTNSQERYELPSYSDMNKDSIFKTKDVNQVKINEVFDEIGNKMLFLYDYGDEWQFIIELLDTDSSEQNEKYPYIIRSSGKAPSQYGDDENGDEATHNRHHEIMENSLDPSQTSLDAFK